MENAATAQERMQSSMHIGKNLSEIFCARSGARHRAL